MIEASLVRSQPLHAHYYQVPVNNSNVVVVVIV
jgi:hypothetical protein